MNYLQKTAFLRPNKILILFKNAHFWGFSHFAINSENLTIFRNKIHYLQTLCAPYFYFTLLATDKIRILFIIFFSLQGWRCLIFQLSCNKKCPGVLLQDTYFICNYSRVLAVTVTTNTVSCDNSADERKC